MEPDEDNLKTPATSTRRHTCAACFKQYKKKEHLIAHMKISFHSIHQPKCGICQKHCKSFESLREHINGPRAKENCSKTFAERGCTFCVKFFDCATLLSKHHEICCQPAPARLGTEMLTPHMDYQIHDPLGNIENTIGTHPVAVAIDCEMVGGGSDGSLDLCARVCLVDEDEKLIFHTYVVPQIPVTNYRYDVTGITEGHLREAMPLKEVQNHILRILYNGESIGRVRLNGGKARVLVGQSLQRDLDCLKMNYPDHLLRDTAKYCPLMKTNLVSHSLKYLVKTYLGQSHLYPLLPEGSQPHRYDIQLGMHDPYEDCVSVMRLYKRLRSQQHQTKRSEITRNSPSRANTNDSWNCKELVHMTPDELFDLSKSNYKCWCLDSQQILALQS